MPQSLAIIAATFPRDVRGRAIGVWAAASAITTSLGPPLGGFLIDALQLARRLPDQPAALGRRAVADLRLCAGEPRRDGVAAPIDWLGSAIAIASLGALTYGLTALSDQARRRSLVAARRSSSASPGSRSSGASKSAPPIRSLPASLFRSRPFLVTNILTLFLYGALAGVLFLLPFDLIERRGMPASAVGTTLLPFGLIIGLLSQPVGRLRRPLRRAQLPGRRLVRGGGRRAPGSR